MSVAQRKLRKKSLGLRCSTEALGTYLVKQTAPTNHLQLADILQCQDRLCPRSENLVFCTCCSTDGWSAFFILRYPGGDNPWHGGRAGDWKHPSRDKKFLRRFTVWMTIWKAAQQNTGVLPAIWSESLFVLFSLVVNAASKSKVYSMSWINETLEGSRKAWYYTTTPDMTQANIVGPRVQTTSLHVLGTDSFRVSCLCYTASQQCFRNCSDFQAGDAPGWSLPITS